jgi:hypothetical protein
MARSRRNQRFETPSLSALFGVVAVLLVVDGGMYAQSNPGPTPAEGAASLSPAQIQEAINNGSKFQTRDKFFEKGLKGVRVKLGPGVLGPGGMSRYVTFFDDWNWIGSEAAAARQQIREVSPSDFHPTGILHALLEVHASGGAGTRRLSRKYLDDRSHLVIRTGVRTIQPTAEKMLMRSDAPEIADLLVGEGGKITVQFEFQVSTEDLKMPTSVILSDGDGKRFEAKVDISTVFVRH